MNLVLEGQLSRESGTREVLQAILSQSSQATGILRISSPRSNLNGKLALVRGRYIVGAHVADTDETGYQAVKKLLSVTDGNFAFLESASPHGMDIDQSLHIGLVALVELLPNLPESSSGLFDEKSLLDEVFSPSGAGIESTRQGDPVVEPTAPAMLPADLTRPPAWNLLNSLIDEGPAVPGETPLLSAASRTGHAAKPESKAMPEQTTPDRFDLSRWPAVVILMTVALCLFLIVLFVMPRLSGPH